MSFTNEVAQNLLKYIYSKAYWDGLEKDISRSVFSKNFKKLYSSNDSAKVNSSIARELYANMMK